MEQGRRGARAGEEREADGVADHVGGARLPLGHGVGGGGCRSVRMDYLLATVEKGRGEEGTLGESRGYIGARVLWCPCVHGVHGKRGSEVEEKGGCGSGLAADAGDPHVHVGRGGERGTWRFDEKTREEGARQA